ncbi:MAG: Hsp20/alpha crystallin family protein [Pseudomonadales bacterium]
MNLISRDSIFDLSRVFDDFFTPSALPGRNAENGFFSPAVDVVEKEDGYTLKLDLPGVKKEDVNLQLRDGMLTIEASHSDENTEEKDGKVIRRERRTGRFARSFSVGRNIAESDISAAFKDGVLEVSLPKVPERTPESNRIAIK